MERLVSQPLPSDQQIKEIMPKAGLVYSEKAALSEILCKPKILPLKSVTLQKLEQMENNLANLQKQ
eukprot:403342193